MKKTGLLLSLLLFLSASIYAMETPISKVSSDVFNPFAGMMVPIEVTRKIMYEVISFGTALDILHTRLACKLFAAQAIQALPEDQKMKFIAEFNKFNSYSKQSINNHQFKVFYTNKILETLKWIDQTGNGQNELAFKMMMTKILGSLQNEEKQSILRLIKNNINEVFQKMSLPFFSIDVLLHNNRIKNLLHYVITFTSEEKTNLIKPIEEEIEKQKIEFDVLSSDDDRTYICFSPSTENLMDSFIFDQIHDEYKDKLALVEYRLNILEKMKSIIEDAPLQQESSNNNVE